MSDEVINARKGRLTVILTGTALGIVITFCFLLLFAAAVYFLSLDRAYAAPLATLSLALGSFSAAYYVSKKIGHRGYLTGALVGLVSFAAVTVISLIVSRGGLGINTLFHFIVIVLASLIGGILGVNRVRNKKYI